ncbi:TRAP transporter substrate-binding protein [Desulfothermus sp.]
MVTIRSLKPMLVLSFFLGFSLLFTGNGFCKVYNIKFQMAWHTQHPEYKAYQKFIKMVEEESKGKIKFTVFPASQLVSRKEALSAVKNGIIDMLASSAAYYHGMVPEGDVDWLPYVSSLDRSKFWHLMNDPGSEFYKIVHDAYLKKANAILLTTIICGNEVVIGRDHIAFKTLEDLKNKKIRAAGGVATRTVLALGANPVTIATGEIYPALQRGTVDGIVFPVYGLKDYKFYEVAKTYTLPPLYTWNDDLWINKRYFKRLPKQLQKVLKDCAYKWGKWASLEYWPNYAKEIQQWVASKKVEKHHFPPEEVERIKGAVKPVSEWYSKESKGCKRLIEILREKGFIK